MPAHIILVEDEEELNDILHYNLTRAGYEVTQVWDGQKALQALQEKAPDLLLLDVMLPGVNGWEICRWLSAQPDLKQVPVIIFTAKSGREDFDQAREFNVAGFFTKPYATMDVVRHVEKVLSARSAKASDEGPPP